MNPEEWFLWLLVHNLTTNGVKPWQVKTDLSLSTSRKLNVGGGRVVAQFILKFIPIFLKKWTKFWSGETDIKDMSVLKQIFKNKKNRVAEWGMD